MGALARYLAICLLIASCATGAKGGPRAYPTDPGDANTKVTLGTPSIRPAAATVANVSAVIGVGEQFFTPQALRIKTGAAVTWRNGGQQNHDVRARDGAFAVGILTPGQSFVFTFTTPGRYRYFCSFHDGEGMNGEIVVEN